MPVRRRTAALLLVAACLLASAPVSGREIRIGTEEGRMHPDFTLPDLSGTARRLSEFRGKKLLLLHFASW